MFLSFVVVPPVSNEYNTACLRLEGGGHQHLREKNDEETGEEWENGSGCRQPLICVLGLSLLSAGCAAVRGVGMGTVYAGGCFRG